ncbi:MAG TPA: hypothetical protein VHX61_18855 [Rhizomicrobium sp.]|jgi:hypothetical protein|nr:hypothetical protein [Rhizomicrobium sp.]
MNGRTKSFVALKKMHAGPGTCLHGLSRADLVPLPGTASRVSEVLAGKRDLSTSMILRPRDQFAVPADVLIPKTRKRIAA